MISFKNDEPLKINNKPRSTRKKGGEKIKAIEDKKWLRGLKVWDDTIDGYGWEKGVGVRKGEQKFPHPNSQTSWRLIAVNGEGERGTAFFHLELQLKHDQAARVANLKPWVGANQTKKRNSTTNLVIRNQTATALYTPFQGERTMPHKKGLGPKNRRRRLTYYLQTQLDAPQIVLISVMEIRVILARILRIADCGSLGQT